MQWMALGNLGFLLIVPAIVALYLLKRNVEDLEVPSTLLWQRTLQSWEAVRPWEKLQRNLLLLLQLLAAVLLVLALVRPAVPAAGAIADHTVLVVDTSGSMLAREGEHTRFQQAVDAARGVVERLSGGQAITLIEAGREPRVLVSKGTDRQVLLQALQSLAPRPGTSDQQAALSLAAAITATDPGSGVMWFGDGGSARAAEQESGLAVSGPFRFVQAGRAKENAAIGAFVTQPGQAGTEGLLRIDNYGSQPVRGRATIYGPDQQVLDVSEFAVEAGSSRTVTFERLPAAPVYRAVIEPEKDGLAEDNERWSVPFAAGKGRAVLVSPQGNRFLHQALQTVGRLEVETRSELPDGTEGAADLWVFDGVVPDRLPEGNILVIAPDRKTDWLPYAGAADVQARPEALRPDDPLVKYVDWQDVHVARTSVVHEMPGMRPLVKAGDTNLVLAGSMAGRRAVIVGFDLHDSDFPLRPAFPIFMQNAASWLSSAQTVPIGPAVPGETLAIPLTPGAGKRTLTYPDGREQAVEAQGTTWLFRVPEQTGLYRLTEEAEGTAQVRYFAVHMDEAESDIAPRSLAVGSGGSGREEAKQQDGQAAGSRELTGWLAALALLAVFAEWRVYQRGY
ncbi:BatA domain-containing protein [Brevibacillus sp. WF146]|uniref:VWA domain-containing protein n=1 Tax=Brevibacillus sp. WF146 TaxID=319501 RepID=UPI0022262E98|nr:VWA domain-containing protein [Brevibacillus sp. WF146]UYZ14141.1 BatA domain-containing protein [Brevibacillus sp. WF146]